MTAPEAYNCGMCGDAFPTRDNYVEHLTIRHPDTWLAKRAKKETELREKRKLANLKK